MALLVEDPAWAEAQAIARHAAAERFQRSSAELAEAVAMAPSTARDATLAALSASLAAQAAAACDAAVPDYADAVLSGMLRRFWCKELIGPQEKARLREALDGFHRIDPLMGVSLPPTIRKVRRATDDAPHAARRSALQAPPSKAPTRGAAPLRTAARALAAPPAE